MHKTGTFGIKTRTSYEPYLHFSDLTKTFFDRAEPFVAVQGFELKVSKGEFVSIIGHSGCGKSTVLMITAGLSEMTTGGIFLDNKMITEPGPDRGVDQSWGR